MYLRHLDFYLLYLFWISYFIYHYHALP
ncbi:hypothetical protein M6B38_306350 [Iris pallida]|uniref:Uncharacterized protein n=1 Tax=Iris pallida TaxID=29817 RepID=A0AAX6HL46_IRIPA|nr:hypothetical protein M6B38_306350 [Iris pallida]